MACNIQITSVTLGEKRCIRHFTKWRYSKNIQEKNNTLTSISLLSKCSYTMNIQEKKLLTFTNASIKVEVHYSINIQDKNILTLQTLLSKWRPVR